jgi:hypothetical protein
VLGLLQIRASDQQRAVVFEASLLEQFRRYFLDAYAMLSEGRQRIVLEGAENDR